MQHGGTGTDDHETDWHDLIDRSFGDGPRHVRLDDRIVAGRRALARRRAASVAGAAAVVAVVAAGTWAVSGGPSSSALPEPAPATRSASAAPTPTTDATADDPADGPRPLTRQERKELWEGGAHAAYDAWGRLTIKKGWTIHQRIPNPMGYDLPAKSVGLEVTNGGSAEWVLVTHEENGGGASWVPAGGGFGTLQAWVDDQVAINSGNRSTPAPGSDVVTMTDDGRLVGSKGAEVLQQVANPDVPGFAEPGDLTAAAKVRDGDQVWFVLARRVAGESDLYPVPAQVLQPGPTMEAFLQRCRERYADGEGLR
ncbi:hypothetical protein EKO23_08455 [Nocardioides guangzhouensis]|uniref:Uncharacterized protein n=1 Tax=Nocardioides guangzhouensis TaxID=2497878 RepID=A0A4Q4ZF29_9ACTN|nr:hypothetical protein [Nocardioides guangzhouensis]RYP86687.1 hypothetical protein EKO23_08455 [Nocardioides guangzhouensis]